MALCPWPPPGLPRACEGPGRGPFSGRETGDGVLPAGLLAHVAGRVDLGEGDLPVGIDEERRPQRHAGLLVEGLVGLSGRAVRPEVAQQREVETLLLAEG